MGLLSRWRRRRRNRRLGWRPDAHDTRDFDIDRLALGGATVSSLSLKEQCPPIYDQGSTNTCVAQAFAAAIEIRERIWLGESTPPSRLFMYYNSRRLHEMHRFDMGTHLRTCAKMLNRVGVPDETLWPFTTKALVVNRRPSFESAMRSHARMGGSYWRIFDTGLHRSVAIKSAVTNGYPVAFGTNVYEDFGKNAGNDVIGLPKLGKNNPLLGGHAMLIVGYREDPEHGLLFEVRNSWGSDWRDGGYAWFTAEYIEAAYSRDFQVIGGWAAVSGGR